MDNYQNSYSGTHAPSSTSIEFESFTFPILPYDIKSSSLSTADKLIFKGQLLPLEPSAREATILSLLASPSSPPSSETIAITSPNSTDRTFSPSSSSSSNAIECDSLECNSTTKYDEYRRHHDPVSSKREHNGYHGSPEKISLSKTFSRNIPESESGLGSKSGRRSSPLLKDIVSSYFNKVNHLHKKLFQKHQQQQQEQNQNNIKNVSTTQKTKLSFPRTRRNSRNSNNNAVFSHCFSGNMQHSGRKSGISSHSGASCKKGFSSFNQAMPICHVNTCSSEELIKEAIEYCKNSMKQ